VIEGGEAEDIGHGSLPVPRVQDVTSGPCISAQKGASVFIS
jgi:hypothetical protein